MRKTPLRKKSKAKVSTLQNKVWELCKQLIRARYGNSCYTCPATDLMGSNWHTGHLWPKACLGAYMKYDLRVLRPQCYNCNINHGGRGADFYKRMFLEIGPEKMSQLERDRQVSVKSYDHYEKTLQAYQQLQH